MGALGSIPINPLPERTLESLLKPENKEKLQNILHYHVIDGKVFSTAVTGKILNPITLNGQPFSVETKMGKVMVNDAKITAVDIEASNGVIHVLNKVILASS